MAQRDEDTGTKSPLLDDDEIGLIDESLRLLSDRADIVVSHFYAMLFAEAPHLRALFPVSMDVQRDRLFRALGGITRTFSEPDRLLPLLAQLGRDHRRYGVRAEHYDVFGRALVAALRYHAKDVWVPELEAAWNKALAVIADAMQAGAREAATREPAWWKGEIVGHERRADDIAVLVVRPDRPYDYVPGQFATVETPYRPRSWRTYSMATAPSPDGLLEFHVRAVGAGWVSGPLVWRAQVGDVVRIGAPAGEMHIDHQSRRDVVCVAGGTGLAPIKAMVDGMSRWNTARRVTLFFGARRSGDLYDLDALHQLAAMNSWLTVVPVVSEESTYAGEQGLLPDAVARHGRWTDHDVFVCGSPAMTRATVTRLTSLGVPPERMSFDVDGDQHPAAAQVIDLRRSRASRAAR
jgi:NAD(P)H-flavin reductase/hemoglobin-like flavoprotein